MGTTRSAALARSWPRSCAACAPIVERLARLDGRFSGEGAAVHTDEWHASDDLDDRGRTRYSVNHKRKEWARDDDEDGVREVHSNTIEGFWLGLRNYLRPFRGVSKWNLDLYLAFHQGMHNFRRDCLGFLHAILRPFTPEGT